MQKTPNIRALKALVIGMGVLIVVGLTIVVVTIAMRAANPEGGDGGRAQTAAGADATPCGPPDRGAPRAFGELALGAADSCRIAGMSASAGTLVVRLDGPAKDGCDRLVVVDPAAGEVLGRIRPGAAKAEGGATAPGQEDSP